MKNVYPEEKVKFSRSKSLNENLNANCAKNTVSFTVPTIKFTDMSSPSQSDKSNSDSSPIETMQIVQLKPKKTILKNPLKQAEINLLLNASNDSSESTDYYSPRSDRLPFSDYTKQVLVKRTMFDIDSTGNQMIPNENFRSALHPDYWRQNTSDELVDSLNNDSSCSSSAGSTIVHHLQDLKRRNRRMSYDETGTLSKNEIESPYLITESKLINSRHNYLQNEEESLIFTLFSFIGNLFHTFNLKHNLRVMFL